MRKYVIYSFLYEINIFSYSSLNKMYLYLSSYSLVKMSLLHVTNIRHCLGFDEKCPPQAPISQQLAPSDGTVWGT